MDAEPKSPTLIGMTEDENLIFLQAYRWAYRCIRRAQQIIQARGYFDTPWLAPKDWDQRNKDIVRESFTKMGNLMSTTPVVIEKAGPDDNTCKKNEGIVIKPFGYTKFESVNGVMQFKSIMLCSRAFQDDWLRIETFKGADWARAFYLIHEISHAAAGTEDHSYSWMACQLLAAAEAVKNAQNYALCAMSGIAQNPPAPRPPDIPPDNGIWVRQPMGNNVWGTTHSLAALAIAEEDMVMMVWRDWAPETKGRLWYKTILDNKDWQDTVLFRSEKGEECRSLVSPALAVRAVGQKVLPDLTKLNMYTVFCVYIDSDSKKLVFIEALVDEPNRGRRWSNLVWRNPAHITELAGASSAGDKLGPAIAVYNTCIFCVYVDASGELKCVWNRTGGWEKMDFDKRRYSNSTPSLTVFDGQLRLSYWDRDAKKMMMLRCVGTKPNRPDAFYERNWDYGWREELNLVPAGANPATAALAQWDTAQGPRLVALGVHEGKDTNLWNAVSAGRNPSPWEKPIRTTTLTGPNCPALAACGSVLHAFYRRQDGRIEWIKSS